MRKIKFTAFLTAILMILSFAITSNSFAALEKNSANWENLTDDKATELLYSAWDGGKESFVIVFYRDTCAYSRNSVPMFLNYAKTNDMKIYGISDTDYPNWNTWMKFFSGKGSVGFPVAIAYNYDKGLIHADDSIRSEESLSEFMKKAGFGTSSSAGANNSAFSDVPSDSRFFEAVSHLVDEGVLSGYADGSFKPHNNITRAEAAAVITRAAKLPDNSSKSSYSDVDDNHWARKYIMAASVNGIINGIGNGKFEPNENVTRNQIIKMLVCMLGLENSAQQSGGWPYGYAYVANRNGIIDNNTNILIFTSDYGDKAATRGEVSEMVYKALKAQ